MDKKTRNKYLYATICCMFIAVALIYYYFFSSMNATGKTQYLYIDSNDNIDSVYSKVKAVSNDHGFTGYRTLVRHCTYKNNIRTGRYALAPNEGAFSLFRHLKNGMQTPVNLTVPSVRTVNKLAAELSKKLMIDSAEIANALSNQDFCQKFGYDTTTVLCLFIPNTYDVYWNIKFEKFMERMQKESRTFWNFERTRKAEEMNLTPNQVITLASIVDEETANDAEKPMIAGMYYNRLMLRDAEYPNGMPLQADPTIKFAWKKFELKRIYNKLLSINSPYNTYRNTGLPPGPIRIPSVAGIDAVLNHVHHKYLYMCAKEDFSGTHNFAVTYEEHMRNAAKYTKALNERNIR